jgi:hypothetical protein
VQDVRGVEREATATEGYMPQSIWTSTETVNSIGSVTNV